MQLESIEQVWQKTPFGATSTETQQNTPPATDPPPNPPATQGNSNPPATEDKDDDPYAGLTPKELRRLLADAEGRANTTEADKKKLQDAIDAEQRKKNDENTNLKNDVAARDTTISELRQALSHQALVNSILLDERFTWHNIDDVIHKLPESVKVDDNGKVSNIAAALGKIAKDNEYLVKSQQGQQDSQQQQPNNSQQQNNGPTGFQPGQGGANSGGALPPNAVELAKNYPALASRTGGGYQAPPVPQHVPGI